MPAVVRMSRCSLRVALLTVLLSVGMVGCGSAGTSNRALTGTTPSRAAPSAAQPRPVLAARVKIIQKHPLYKACLKHEKVSVADLAHDQVAEDLVQACEDLRPGGVGGAPNATDSTPSERLHDLGSLTVSDGHGTTIRQHYELGELQYGRDQTPPTAVLEACNFNYDSTISQSVFAPGEVTVSYTEGLVATDLAIVPNQLFRGLAGGSPVAGVVAFEMGGSFQCQGADGAAGLTTSLAPGESKSFPIWVMVQALSNETPKLSNADLATWQFQPDAITVGGTFNDVRATGSNAVNCEGRGHLALFAVHPGCATVGG